MYKLQDFIHSCWERINRLVEEWTASQTQNSAPSSSSQSAAMSSGTQRNSSGGDSTTFDAQVNRLSDYCGDRNNSSNQQRSENKTDSRKQTTSVTPTDVRDVHF